MGACLHLAEYQNNINVDRDEAGRNEKWDGLTQLGWQDIASNNHHMFLEQIQIPCEGDWIQR